MTKKKMMLGRLTTPSQPTLLCLAMLVTANVLGADPLRDGNEAYRSGDYPKAAEFFESEDETSDLLTRRFNAGVSWMRSGDLKKATERFEDVTSRAAGELRQAAIYNLGWVHFQTAQATLAADTTKDSPPAQPPEAPEQRLEQLTNAAQSLTTSVEFFRRVEPPNEDVLYNVSVVKTALRTVLDEIARIEEEKRKQEEEELLKEPSKLILHLIQTEKNHRALSRQLKDAPQRRRRLPCRQLRKAEALNRGLAEKLLHYVTAELAKDPGADDAEMPEDEKARLEQGKSFVSQAVSAMQNAEVDYGRLDTERAAASHTTAIRHLRTALFSFPLDIAAVIGDGIKNQREIIGMTEDLQKETQGSIPGEEKATGVGKMLLSTLKNKLLQPLAKLLKPQPADEAAALADEEEEVIWAAQVVSKAEIPPSPPQAATPPGGAGQVVGPHGGMAGGAPQGPVLDEAAAKELSEGLQAAGAEALSAAEQAREQLAAADLDAALTSENDALAALEKAQELLPKPPKTVEQRLAELIESQRATKTAVKGVAELPEESRAPAKTALIESQGGDGKEAGEIATALESRQDERAQAALPKVQEGESAIFSSAEALRRDLAVEAEAAVDRDIAALEEALAILSGQDEKNQDQQQQDQDQQQQQQQQQQGDGNEDEQQQAAYQLSPAEAREERDKMDQDRRKEEANIFSGGAPISVEKDW